MPTLTETTEGAIWSRVIQPDEEDLTPEVARALLRLEFPEPDRRRMHELAAKAREDTLTPAESEEVASYERVGSFLSLVKAKARVCLKNGDKRPGRASRPAQGCSTPD
jgi:hypothetical protein